MDKIERILKTVEILDDHAHSVQKVSPSGAAGIAVTSGAGAWNLGAFSADIIAAGAVALPFDIHGVDIENPDANAEYELVLYYGAADTEAGRCTFTRTNAITISRSTSMQTPLIPAGSRVRAKLMDSAGAASITIKIWFHTY